MVSFAVNSLFTNIQLTESIDLAVSYILQNNVNHKLSKEDLTKLFSFATAQTHFLSNGSTYDQIDGVSMGSPLATILANLFMDHHEKIWLENFNKLNVIIYRRYVDDTFCLFNFEHGAMSFFNFLNKQHPNITLLMEKETNNKLAFLMSWLTKLHLLLLRSITKPLKLDFLLTFSVSFRILIRLG